MIWRRCILSPNMVAVTCVAHYAATRKPWRWSPPVQDKAVNSAPHLASGAGVYALKNWPPRWMLICASSWWQTTARVWRLKPQRRKVERTKIVAVVESESESGRAGARKHLCEFSIFQHGNNVESHQMTPG